MTKGAQSPQYVCAGHRPRKYAPFPSSPHRLLYLPAVLVSSTGQARNERLTSQKETAMVARGGRLAGRLGSADAQHSTLKYRHRPR